MTMRESSVQGTGAPDRGAPGRIWYLLAVIVFLAGMAAFTIFLVTQIGRLGDNLVRVTVPGEHEMTLAAGDYTIFHEEGGTSDGRILSSGGISGMRVSVQRPGGGALIPLTPNSSSRYALRGRSGQSVFSFTIAEGGLYRLTAAYDDGRTSPPALLAVGRGFMADLLKTIFGGLAIALGGALVATLIGLGIYRRRRRAAAPPSSAG